MKRALPTRVLALTALLLLAAAARAQVNVVITKAMGVTHFPTSALAYTSNPADYFRIMLSNTSMDPIDVSLDIDLRCTTGGTTFTVGTTNHVAVFPAIPLAHAGQPGSTFEFTSLQQFEEHFSHRLTTNVEDPMEVLMLPEGYYEICITAFALNADHTARTGQVGHFCYSFNICYSGTAPEFTSPVIGLSTSNTHVPSDPADQASGSHSNDLTSSLNNSSAYQDLYPTQRTNFTWSRVSGSCFGPNDFDYTFKVVEVLPGQTAQDAMDHGTVVFSRNMGSSTRFTYDYRLTNEFRMDSGHVYAVQVLATTRDPQLVATLGNDGKSQLLAFRWHGPTVAGTTTRGVTRRKGNTHTTRKPNMRQTTTDNQSEVLAGIQHARIRTPEEGTLGTDSLSLSVTPTTGNGVQRTDYTLKVFEFIGDTATSMLRSPIYTKFRPGSTLAAGAQASAATLFFSDTAATHKMERGVQYLVHLEASTAYSYQRVTTTTEVQLVNGMPDPHKRSDTVNLTGNILRTDNAVFQWGVDSTLFSRVKPPQFTFPVDMSGKPLDDTVWRTEEFPTVSKEEQFELHWVGAENISVKDSVFYDLLVVQMKKGKRPEQCLKDTVYYRANIYNATHFINDTLLDTLLVGNMYAMRLTVHVPHPSEDYIFLNKGHSHFCTFTLGKDEEYTGTIDEKLACFPNDTKNLSKEKLTTDPKELIAQRTKIKIGRFDMVIQRAEKNDKHQYTGEGYVEWFPMGKWGCGVKVTFDTITINKDLQVIGGFARSAAEDSANYIKIGVDNTWTNLTDDGLNLASAKLGDWKKAKAYMDYINMGSNMLGESIHSSLQDNGVSLGVVNTPIGVSPTWFDEGQRQNIIVGINEMYFSPVTALMSLVCIYHSSEDNLYIPLVAPGICTSPNAFFSDSTEAVRLALLRDFETQLEGYKVTLKRSTDLTKPEDGTYITFDNKGLDEVALEVELQIGDPTDPNGSIMAVSMKDNGTPLPGQPVTCRFFANFNKWNDWVARASMDPFAVEGAEGFTFVPGGKGIFFDHSSTETPKEVTFPKNYFGHSDTDKKRKEWKGLYMDDFRIFLPPDVSNTFQDLNGDTAAADTVLVYKMGPNNSMTDSTQYMWPTSRISGGARGLIVDANGFTADLAIYDLLHLSHSAGWNFSIDTLGVRFEKNAFQKGYLKGQMRLPLMSGQLGYECALGTDSLNFTIKVNDPDFRLDLWLAYIKLDPSSHFSIQSYWGDNANGNIVTNKDGAWESAKGSRTKIDVTLNGVINIAWDSLGIPVDFKGVKFENMYMRNYDTVMRGKKAAYALTPNFEFDFGTWSKASPQKRVGGAPSNRYGETALVDARMAAPDDKEGADDNKPIAGGCMGAFCFNLNTITPVFESAGEGYYKLGIAVGGDVSIGIGGFQGNDATAGKRTMGVGAGFQVWGEVNPTSWDTKGWGGQLDSISLSVDLDMFYLKGKVAYYSKDGINGAGDHAEGWFGSLDVRVMEVVEVKMAAGFGNGTDDNGEDYDWWFFEGGARWPSPGFNLGVVSFLGLSGGFAYNMDCAENVLNIPTSQLLAKAPKVDFDTTYEANMDNMVNGEMAYTPKKDSWVAKAGVVLAMGTEEVCNADGMLTLRVGDGHFTGIVLDVNAHFLAKFDEELAVSNKSQEEKDKESKAVLNARAVIGYESNPEYHHFRFALCAKAEISLASLLSEEEAIPKMPSDINVKFSGNSISVNLDTLKTETPKEKDGSALSASMHFQLPLEFEFKKWKKATTYNGRAKKKGQVEWYIAIGKPKKEERASFGMELKVAGLMDVGAEFTMYLITGNSFEYKLPPIDPEVEAFLFGGADKSITRNQLEVARGLEQMFKNGQFADAGGFAMGVTFKAHAEVNAFIYFSVHLNFGFDVALLNTKGAKCGGYNPIGKHNFYALGQIYAMIEGEIGLGLDLGFWEGHVTLCKAGVGALLQGGGPNPSWAYGIVRLKAELLGGLIKFNTAVDFKFGDVCVPGAGDPLANVKLFEKVSPGYDTESEAKKKDNFVSPLNTGLITSNMPWNEDIVLMAPNEYNEMGDPRKFRFMLCEDSTQYDVTSQGVTSRIPNPFTYYYDPDYTNNIMFNTAQNGFTPDADHRLIFVGRAYEFRQRIKNEAYHDSDHPVDIHTGKYVADVPDDRWAWYNPEYDTIPQPWTQRDTFYFHTTGFPPNLIDQVVYSWPYDGDPFVPIDELPEGRVQICLAMDRGDLLDPNELRKNNKVLQVFLIKQGQPVMEADTCAYEYHRGIPGQATPYLIVKLPSKYYGDLRKKIVNHIETPGTSVVPLQVAIYTMDKETFDAKRAEAEKRIAEAQTSTTELTTRDLLDVVDPDFKVRTVADNTFSTGTPLETSPTGRRVTKNGSPTTMAGTGWGGTHGSGKAGSKGKSGGKGKSSSKGKSGSTGKSGSKGKPGSTGKPGIIINANDYGKPKPGRNRPGRSKPSNSSTLANTGSAIQQNVNIEDAIRQVGVDAYYADGADTVMAFKRLNSENYEVFRTSGTLVYSLCFRFDPNDIYKNYKEILEFYAQGAETKGSPFSLEKAYGDPTNDDGNLKVAEDLTIDNDRREQPYVINTYHDWEGNTQYNLWLRKFSYLFQPMYGKDSSAYMNGVMLPPIAYMVADVPKSITTGSELATQSQQRGNALYQVYEDVLRQFYRVVRGATYKSNQYFRLGNNTFYAGPAFTANGSAQWKGLKYMQGRAPYSTTTLWDERRKASGLWPFYYLAKDWASGPDYPHSMDRFSIPNIMYQGYAEGEYNRVGNQNRVIDPSHSLIRRIDTSYFSHDTIRPSRYYYDDFVSPSKIVTIDHTIGPIISNMLTFHRFLSGMGSFTEDLGFMQISDIYALAKEECSNPNNFIEINYSAWRVPELPWRMSMSAFYQMFIAYINTYDNPAEALTYVNTASYTESQKNSMAHRTAILENFMLRSRYDKRSLITKPATDYYANYPLFEYTKDNRLGRVGYNGNGGGIVENPICGNFGEYRDLMPFDRVINLYYTNRSTGYPIRKIEEDFAKKAQMMYLYKGQFLFIPDTRAGATFTDYTNLNLKYGIGNRGFCIAPNSWTTWNGYNITNGIYH